MTGSQRIGEMTEKDFGRIAEIARREAGIELPSCKIAMIQSRVFRHMRRIGFQESISRFIDEIMSDNERRQELVSVLTTNVTGFFREPHHFATLRDFLTSKAKARETRFRIWSAGCSGGQEPYSISMICHEVFSDLADIDLRILATDIDRDVLDRARRGVYSSAEIQKIEATRLERFFDPIAETGPEAYSASKDVRQLVSFKPLNLHGDWPMKGPFDAIFCRNVVIYFSDQSRTELWPRFHEYLAPGGFLFIGHSERIHPLKGSGFEAAGVTTFRKVAA